MAEASRIGDISTDVARAISRVPYPAFRAGLGLDKAFGAGASGQLVSRPGCSGYGDARSCPSASLGINCYGNTAVERCFKSLKAEVVWHRTWQTRREVEIALFEYINGF